MDGGTKLWGLALIAILVLIACLTWAMPGHCAFCPAYACFDSSACGQGCVCAKINGGIQGICASVD